MEDDKKRELTITAEPISEKANSKRPRFLEAPSGNINSGCDCVNIRASYFKYGEKDGFCCRIDFEREVLTSKTNKILC